MDKSLDELIKITRKTNTKKPAIKKVQQAKAPGGRKGAKVAGAKAKLGGALGAGRVKLAGIGKKSKVRRAMKSGAGSMDVEMGGGKNTARGKSPGKGPCPSRKPPGQYN